MLRHTRMAGTTGPIETGGATATVGTDVTGSAMRIEAMAMEMDTAMDTEMAEVTAMETVMVMAMAKDATAIDTAGLGLAS